MRSQQQIKILKQVVVVVIKTKAKADGQRINLNVALRARVGVQHMTTERVNAWKMRRFFTFFFLFFFSSFTLCLMLGCFSHHRSSERVDLRIYSLMENNEIDKRQASRICCHRDGANSSFRNWKLQFSLFFTSSLHFHFYIILCAWRN